MKGIFNFETSIQENQWHNGELDERLKGYVTIICYYSWIEFNKRLIINSVYRTPEHDKKIGGSGIHCYWRAVDILTHNLTENQITKIVDMANIYFHYDSADKHLVAKYGDKRHKKHIHYQVGWR